MQDPSGFWAPSEKPGVPPAETATGNAARANGMMLEKRIVREGQSSFTSVDKKECEERNKKEGKGKELKRTDNLLLIRDFEKRVTSDKKVGPKEQVEAKGSENKLKKKDEGGRDGPKSRFPLCLGHAFSGMKQVYRGYAENRTSGPGSKPQDWPARLRGCS